MNIETANRLYEYRRKNNLSQEELAEKIGVSRQAVSKWERAEASPDTDNLIQLSKVYGVSLDDLIHSNDGEDTIENNEHDKENQDNKDTSNDEEPENEADESYEKTNENDDHVSFKNGIHVHSKDGDHVDVGLKGIHVVDKNGENVHVDWTGVHVDSKKDDTYVSVDKDGVFVEENGETKAYTDDEGHVFVNGKDVSHSKLHSFFNKFPYPIITVILYLCFGFFNVCGGWAFGWLIFLTIPLYYTIVSAIFHRNPSHFAYPVLVVLVYLYLGFAMMLWHPMWILFLTIPLYYFICDMFKRVFKHK